MRAMLLTLGALALIAPAFAGPAAAGGGSLPEVCVPVLDFPDNGLAYCVDADGPCLLLERRTTIIGQTDTCLVEHPL